MLSLGHGRFWVLKAQKDRARGTPLLHRNLCRSTVCEGASGHALRARSRGLPEGTRTICTKESASQCRASAGALCALTGQRSLGCTAKETGRTGPCVCWALRYITEARQTDKYMPQGTGQEKAMAFCGEQERACEKQNTPVYPVFQQF